MSSASNSPLTCLAKVPDGSFTQAARSGLKAYLLCREYEGELRTQNVQPSLCRAEDEATAACLCLVSSHLDMPHYKLCVRD